MSSPYLRHSYGFDLDIVKSPSTSSSSPSSTTLSESSNSPRALSTRKPRTPRKRPNQTYNEAAALLSTAYPNIFSAKNLSHNPCKFNKPHHFLDEPSSELLWPFRVFDEDSGFLLHQVQPINESEKPNFSNEVKVSNFMNNNNSSSNSVGNSSEFGGFEEDFDAESILDEEIQEGIDSIMGNLSVSTENSDELTNKGFQFNGRFQGFGNNGVVGKGVRAFRHGGEANNWWCFPIVDMLQISPRLCSSATNNNKVPDFNSKSKQPKTKPAAAKSNSGEKKKTKVEKSAPAAELKNSELNSVPESSVGLMLKLNYDGVLNAWSDRGSPFSDESSGSESANDVSARLAQIDLLFTENGGIREASVLRYKEKRRTRLFSKKIRYEVRKVNADQRPRMKGRFVRRPHSSASSQKRREEEEDKKIKK